MREELKSLYNDLMKKDFLSEEDECQAECILNRIEELEEENKGEEDKEN